MTLSPGTRLGTYQIVGRLGAGGMGEVYRGHDTRLGRDVAIKVLPADVTGSSERLLRFEREARIVASLNHPNIVTLHSIEEAAGVRFITMELIEGRTLAELLVPGGLPVDQALNLLIPIADALAAAHGKGVVHRDLKPANVMVTSDLRVKVLDFGLAKSMHAGADLPSSRFETETTPVSMAGRVFGTVPYMAPEQISGEAVDERTDLFAFGAMVFELVAGRRAFSGRTFLEVSAAILRDAPPSLGSLRGDIPAHLGSLVTRCLEKEPASRPQTAQELANTLRAIRNALQRGEEPSRHLPSTPLASVAVLPFVNRSASADDEYFSDGLADELLGVLAKIKGLRVPARASSFSFKGRNVPLAEIGRALNVETVLDGSVRRSGNRVRISVQLVKVSDGYHLWSETYDRTFDDIFAVQDDIAQSVVKELRATLLSETLDSDASGRTRAEVNQAARGRSADPEAYRLYLLARHSLDQMSRESTAKGVSYLKQALERDPRFAHAWAELSRAYVREAGLKMVPPAEGYEEGRKAADRAVALEPQLSDGLVQLAWIQMFLEWDWQGAEASLRRARELSPDNSDVIRLSGILASIHGRIDEAVVMIRRALEQDPLSSGGYHSLGYTLELAGDPSAAEEAFRRALELAPQRFGSHAHLAWTMLALNRSTEALSEAASEPEEAYRLWALTAVHRALGNQAESDAALEQLSRKYADSFSIQVAEALADRGQKDDAFHWLDEAFATRDTGLARLKMNPRLRPLHDDARWKELLKKMRLE